uniref:Centrosomal protein CEP41 n=1 Tax=Tetraselmis sp. GSL018 TaxID=582737 RepID=A0A061S6Y0_9CHLO|mmetsp:Transcript_36816/g.87465  ORF Transcript_36816/g.87465 Transcript_36816/m.87465 type:complete len:142 (-) Transcript_36816:160-585(-)|eukprot:CAMPEP_0177602456 /NCGR_PEP_ID=MMETSP0419_2-20121207/14873_1 /TAXON_ID=582737 /ORGANISM="Tetraselmis sp., Strain GSL018" /LENGTH=141 /DNA_ID=CAMNT_0019095931 /DNA_START=770 /DNA_END=1195 /DNA_ORIENTATION=-
MPFHSMAPAKNYPARMLSRAMHPFTPEILDYSNREPERIIVIYDLDERIVLNAGNLFFEKGIDNVFVLSGGMKKLAKDAPWFIEGKGQVTEGTSSPSKDSAISLGSSCPSSALSYQTRPPRRAPALDGPLTHNRGTAQPWK